MKILDILNGAYSKATVSKKVKEIKQETEIDVKNDELTDEQKIEVLDYLVSKSRGQQKSIFSSAKYLIENGETLEGFVMPEPKPKKARGSTKTKTKEFEVGTYDECKEKALKKITEEILVDFNSYVDGCFAKEEEKKQRNRERQRQKKNS